ncbi:thiopurine S-methyltransferase [Thalassotalea sp. M1531]|uniref:Thiopurine S-methyltransferase n=1 Tax=Thalassotalea algicola TaxID=2716224 RepID=A0A7Y0Q6M9_9GAMM|nr:thiopurine S-methyltransferase [Thalassotalea algicola]NMP31341.1 thiopurine S-methyltransferase [Thalassotalea algicola]
MKAEFWHKCWEKKAIGFHQDAIHPFLKSELAQLNFSTSDTVFVPLCGKSLDMLWWAERCQVVGSELSEIACQEFFAENDLTSQKRKSDAFTVYQLDNLAIYQGDFFALAPNKLPKFKYIYDRAALIALPEQMQKAYAAHLSQFIGQNTELLLISVEFPNEEHQGPPFSTSAQCVNELFDHFVVEELAVNELKDKQFARRSLDVSYLTERLYRITRS